MSAPCPEFGFVLRATFDATEGESTAIVDAFTAELIELLESNGMTARGSVDEIPREAAGGDGVAVTINITRDGAQATDADRQLVAAWANQWPTDARITVSGLVDLTELAE